MALHRFDAAGPPARRGWATTQVNAEPRMRALFAADALLPAGWAHDVLLQWDADGALTRVQPVAPCPPGVPRAAGPVLPGVVNLHSHAFQRAFAGLTEFRGEGTDSFWSWRDRMYRLAKRVTPEELEDIATLLYAEMLEAGYTAVCEFHYLHHGVDGRAHADDAEMSHALVRAARRTGIAMTLLPVLYQTSDFGGAPATEAQRRFVRGTDSMLRLLERLRPACAADAVRLGVAAHSLRAVPPDSLRVLLEGMTTLDPTAPVHIHIAEQTGEVDACVRWCGQRPVEWLLDHAPVDRRWCLVHATHLAPSERARAARTGAVAGLCPTTEANLGDGLFDLPAWRQEAGGWGIGSDSHVCVNAAEEFMLLEYGHRLWRRERNVLAAPGEAVATSLLLQAVPGGAQAAGRPAAGLAPGQRADLVVLDAQDPLLAGLDAQDALSAHVFASHRRSAIAQVWVDGSLKVDRGRHPLRDEAARRYVHARRALAA